MIFLFTEGENSHERGAEFLQHGIQGKADAHDEEGGHIAEFTAQLAVHAARHEVAQPVQNQVMRHVDEEGSRPQLGNGMAEARQVLLAQAADAHGGEHPQQHQRGTLHGRVEAPAQHGGKQQQRTRHGSPRMARQELRELLHGAAAADEEPAAEEAQRQHAFIGAEGQPRLFMRLVGQRAVTPVAAELAVVGFAGLAVHVAQHIACGKGDEHQHQQHLGRQLLQHGADEGEQQQRAQEPQRHIRVVPVAPGGQPQLPADVLPIEPMPIPRQGIRQADEAHAEERPEDVGPQQLPRAPPRQPLPLFRLVAEVPAHQEEKEDETAVVEQVHHIVDGRPRAVKPAVHMAQHHHERRVHAAEINPLNTLLRHKKKGTMYRQTHGA